MSEKRNRSSPAKKYTGRERGAMKPRPQPPGPQHADFEALYERHSRGASALVYARWLNADVALDIMQEASWRLRKYSIDRVECFNPPSLPFRDVPELADSF